MIREEVVQKLMATGKWSRESAQLGEKSNYHCEYCGLDLFATVENYKLWQVDHIVPTSCGGSLTDFDNLALACRTCNVIWKGRYNPRRDEPEGNREKLIEVVRQYIGKRRHQAEEEFEGFRRIVGHGV